MTKLTAKRRRKLPASVFAGPDRSYPIPDRSHAANAKARAKQQLNRHALAVSKPASEAAYDRIVARANVKLKGK